MPSATSQRGGVLLFLAATTLRSAFGTLSPELVSGYWQDIPIKVGTLPRQSMTGLSNVIVYCVALDSNRRQAYSGSMDGTIRVWNLKTGECQYTLTSHNSPVALLRLSPSHFASAAADTTLRIWNPDTGELRHTLATHRGPITSFQHDEFKALGGSDGSLKMWDVRDGTVVRELLSNIYGVWQVVFEGRWCVAASHLSDKTMLDVWDFGNGEPDEDWTGEPVGGKYDEDMTDDEDEEMEQGDADTMDKGAQDLDIPPPESEMNDEPIATFSDEPGTKDEAFEIVDHVADGDWCERSKRRRDRWLEWRDLVASRTSKSVAR
jgi:F-box and WD-40 domain protein CDC4